mgnify:CR=1 FL=1
MWNEIISRLDVEALVTEATAFIIGYIPDVVVACAVLIGFWLFYRVSSLAIRGLLTRSGIHTTLISMLVDNVYRYTVLGFGIIMAADQIGVNVGAALAGIGVVGIAVGFAAQDRAETVIGICRTLVREFDRHGVKKIVFVNGHYENYQFIFEGVDLALRDLAAQGGELPRVMMLSYWDFVTPAVIERLYPDARAS